MPLANSELAGFDANSGIRMSMAAGCDFDCVGTWVIPAAEFEGFGALFAGPDFEGSS